MGQRAVYVVLYQFCAAELRYGHALNTAISSGQELRFVQDTGLHP